MSPVNLNDLPKAVRERIAGQEGAVAKARARKASAAESGPAYRCGKCPETFTHYGIAAERHMDEVHRGGRLEMVF